MTQTLVIKVHLHDKRNAKLNTVQASSNLLIGNNDDSDNEDIKSSGEYITASSSYSDWDSESNESNSVQVNLKTFQTSWRQKNLLFHSAIMFITFVIIHVISLFNGVTRSYWSG